MTSEDYQNELNNDTQNNAEPIGNAVTPEENVGVGFDEKITSEIPVDVDTMGVVIDKAPSLSTDDLSQVPEEISANDINDLMADLMSSMGSEESVEESDVSVPKYEEAVAESKEPVVESKEPDISSVPNMGIDEETIEAGRALEEYLNSPVEQLINHPEVPSSLGFEIPDVDSIDTNSFDIENTLDFPSLPQMPDIPEVVEREHVEVSEAPEVESADAFSGFDLEPITIDNFDDHFTNNESENINADEAFNVEETVNLEEPAYVEEAVSAEEPVYAEEPVSLEEPIYVEEPEGVEEPAHAEETVNVDEPAYSEDAANSEEPANVEDMADVLSSNIDSADNFADAQNNNIVNEAAIEEAETASAITADELEDLRKELAESENDDDDESLGEDDIEKMLARAQNDAENPENDEARDNMSLEELLQTSNDNKTDDIGELLDKAERNEAIDEGIAALLDGKDMPPIDFNDPMSDGGEENLDPKAAKKAEKLRLKEEKKEAKRKAKEAKAAEKLAKKNAKAAKKSADGKDNQSDNSTVTKFVYNEGDNQNAFGQEQITAPVIPSADEMVSSGIEHNTDMSDVEALLADDLFSQNAGDDEVDGTQGSNAESASDADHNGGKSLEALSFDALNNGDESATSEDAAEGNIDDIPEKDAKEKKNPFKAFFGKIIDFLTEEDEDSDEKSAIILSDENAAILDELDGEGSKGGKKKKKKKGKKQSSGNEESAEELPEKKPPKKKKEKKPKKTDENEKPEPKISKKKVSMVALVCIMLGVTIFLMTYFTADYTAKKSGRDAFLKEDYQTCYQNLYGKKLNETEQIMYNRSECILKIQIWLREYEIYEEEGSEVKALDSLIQSVDSYPELKASAEEWGCIENVEPVYNSMVNILQGKYGLSEDKAKEIAAIEDDLVYTRVVNAIVSGVAYEDALNYIYTDDISGNTPTDEGVNAPANMDDILPEEDGVSGDGFIEP